MRYLLFWISLLILVNGCKEVSNIVTPVSEVVDSLQYTFDAPRIVWGTHDTLSAAVTVYNRASVPETVMVTGFSFRWFLQDGSGRTIMFGPRQASWFIGRFQLGPHQSKKIYGFSEAISDTSGQPVPAGLYLLKATVDTLHFSLNLRLE